jgi:hypothetical protein
MLPNTRADPEWLFTRMVLAFVIGVPLLWMFLNWGNALATRGMLPAVTAFLTCMQVATIVFAAPRTTQGRAGAAFLTLPLAGTAATALSMSSCCPGGHPTFATLFWMLNLAVTCVALAAAALLLRMAARKLEKTSFLVTEALFAVLNTVAVAAAPAFGVS